MPNSIQGILLAAGCSRRFGSNKLLQSIVDNTTIAESAGQRLLTVLPNSIAILRPDDQALQILLQTIGFQIIINPRAEQGIGTSIACAVSATTDAEGWLITLADMPFIHPSTIQKITHIMQQGATISAPTYQGQRGHPVGFSAKMAHQLKQLHGDQGAAHLLRTTLDLHLIEVNDPMILYDIDQPSDINHIQPS